MTEKTTYIVAGCDGKLGGRVAENMLKEVSGEQLIFTCPDLNRLPEEKKSRWEAQGVSVRQANYDNVEEMTEAFKGGDRIYIVSTILNGPIRVMQHKNAFDASVAAGVKHIVYTSAIGADQLEFIPYVLPDHIASEAYLKEMAGRLGFTYNIMRNSLYMDNYLTDALILANLNDYVWGTNAGNAMFTPIAKDDSAACATALLLGKGEPNTAYNLTSDVPICQKDICELVAAHSGLPFKYVVMNNEEYLEVLDRIGVPRTTEGFSTKAPVLWCSNDMVTNEGNVGAGNGLIITNDVEKLLGRKPLHVSDLLDYYSYMWEEKVVHWTGVR